MRGIVVLICIIGVALTEDILDEFVTKAEKASDSCKAEVGTTDEDIKAIKAHQIPSTHTGKCYIHCIATKLDLVKEDGSVIQETIDKFLAKAKEFDELIYIKFKAIGDECLPKVVSGGDPCESSASLAECAQTEMKKNGLPEPSF